MLELIPVSHDVKALLSSMLPVCGPEDDLAEDAAMACFVRQSVPLTKADVFDDLPAPVSQCEEAWRDVLAFELDGRSARVGAEKALSIYRALLSHLLIKNPGVDLAGAGIDVEDFRKAEAASRIDIAILEAVLSHLRRPKSVSDLHRLYYLDQAKTLQWTGKTLLEVRHTHGRGGFSRAEFLQAANELLPTAWARKEIDQLPDGVHEKSQGGTTVVYVESAEAPEIPLSKAQSETPAPPSGKRKWHDMFKAQRKDTKR